MWSARFDELRAEFDFVLTRLKASRDKERTEMLDLLQAIVKEAVRSLAKSQKELETMQQRIRSLQELN
jgi:hypothetical protein